MIVLWAALVGLAAASEPWLTTSGAGGLAWGAAERPAGALPRPRSDFLPDSGYIGSQPDEQPEDLMIPVPPGDAPIPERRYVRYAHGQLVDAWLVREGPISTADIQRVGQEQWAGVVLGPAPEPGWRALGYAQSWQIGSRTAFYWKDRLSETEIVALRDGPGPRYAVQRAAPVGADSHPSTRDVTLKGDLKKMVKPHAAAISGCLDHAPKPVTAIVRLRYDGTGRPARIQVETDQPAAGVIDCMAGAIADTRAPELTEGEFVAFRMR